MEIQNQKFEEFKILNERIRDHESRYYQLIIFTITVFGVILGLYQNIPNILTPILLYSVLYITTSRGYYSRYSLSLIGTYIKKYNSDRQSSKVSSFSSFKDYYLKMIETEKRQNNTLIKKIKHHLSFIKRFWKGFWYYMKEPFLIISFIAFTSSLILIFMNTQNKLLIYSGSFNDSGNILNNITQGLIVAYVLFVQTLLIKRIVEYSNHTNDNMKKAEKYFDEYQEKGHLS